MKNTEIVRINEKGAIIISEVVRDQLGMVEGMHVMLRIDIEKREINITPFTTAEVDLVEFTITLSDVPGALAKSATFLADQNINLLASESRTIQSGELAEWIVVADISNCKENIRELCKDIAKKGYARNAICRSFH